MRSTPIKDQVPELMYMAFSWDLGTASTAEAVSWVPGRTTLQSNPTSLAISGRRLPTSVPGRFSSPKISSGRPSMAISSRSQVFALALTSWVVVARVYSFMPTPVSR